MRAIIDTCIIIDALQNREPFSADAQKIFLSAANNRFIGCITAKAVLDIYYLMHRHTHDDKASRNVLSKLLTIFELSDTTAMDCRHAILSSLSDFEDAVMVETGVRIEADCIVTRNTKDFLQSRVAVYTPAEFFEKISATEEKEEI